MLRRLFVNALILTTAVGCGGYGLLTRGTGESPSLNQTYFTANIQPVINSNCACHASGGSNPFSYADWTQKATAGRFYPKAQTPHYTGTAWSGDELAKLTNWISGASVRAVEGMEEETF